MTERFYRALRMAIRAHDGQVDKGGLPYILHPLHVAMQFQTEDEQIIALFHDVVEDTKFTLDDIASWGFLDLVYPVDCLTKRKGKETYEEYLERVCGDCRALRVKIEDMRHNLDEARLSEEARVKLSKKRALYAEWLPKLEERLAELVKGESVG